MEKIVKRYTKVDKTTGEKKVVETEYRIDAEFVPSKQEEICEEFIINYCKDDDNNAEWLYSQFTEIVKDKNGKAVKKSFLQIRKEFISKFFPALLVGKKKSNAKDDFIAMMKEKKK